MAFAAHNYFPAIAIQRLAHVLSRAKAPVIPRMLTEWAHGRAGSTPTQAPPSWKNAFLRHSVPANFFVIYEGKQLSILDKTGRNQITALEWSI